MNSFSQIFFFSKATTVKRRPTKWRCPPSGRLKINVDGVFHAAIGQGGIGVVARDESGRCLAALARFLPHNRSALVVEAEAMLAGLLVALYEQWSEVEFESDSSMVLTALSKEEEDLSEVLVATGVCAVIGQLSKPFTNVILYCKEFYFKSTVQAGGFNIWFDCLCRHCDV